AAYSILGNAHFPWTLPFNLFAEEARIYLNHLGVPRHILMEHFQRDQGNPSPEAVAAEYLGLTSNEREIVTGAAGPLHELWGFDSQGAFNTFISDHRVSGILDQSGLKYEDLTALLDVEFVDPAGGLRIRFADADCNLNTATITNLNATALNRMHRFVRLQRKLDWSIAE